MTIRLIEMGWGDELKAALRKDGSVLRIVCPFIKLGALQDLLERKPPGTVQVITRFNLDDFVAKVSDIAALELLLSRGAEVRGISNLHSKLYLFGNSQVVVTSANLTMAALNKNLEFGFASSDASVLQGCRAYFDALWPLGKELVQASLEEWRDQVEVAWLSGIVSTSPGLGDYGANVGGATSPPHLPDQVAEARQGFVKFFGEGSNREPLATGIGEMIKDSGCHWALSYPGGKRPRAVMDGAVMFIARLTRGPNDIRIFGRAIASRHIDQRDVATDEDIQQHPWKKDWSSYIRVHDATFINGTLADGVSLNELMVELGYDSFASTQRNARSGKSGVNTDPRKAYLSAAAVELSREGLARLSRRFQDQLNCKGAVPQKTLDGFYRPIGLSQAATMK